MKALTENTKIDIKIVWEYDTLTVKEFGLFCIQMFLKIKPSNQLLPLGFSKIILMSLDVLVLEPEDNFLFRFAFERGSFSEVPKMES